MLRDSSPKRVLFIFLDGVGIGPEDPDRNPFLVANLPTLRKICGGAIPSLDDAGRCVINPSPTAVVVGLDAVLGVSEGIPQSGTGQAALLTGENAPAAFGRHFGPWVPSRLRDMVAESNLFRRALDRGIPAIVGNAYPSAHRDKMMVRRTAGFPLAAYEAGLLTRDERDLAEGTAVASEILNLGWREALGFEGLPRIDAEGAGRTLAGLGDGTGLTGFAHYSTDSAGHEMEMRPAVRSLERVDRFLGGAIETMGSDTLLLIASDHGNIEDVTQSHTRNPTLGVALGPGAERLLEAEAITDVPGLVMDAPGAAGGS